MRLAEAVRMNRMHTPQKTNSTLRAILVSAIFMGLGFLISHQQTLVPSYPKAFARQLNQRSSPQSTEKESTNLEQQKKDSRAAAPLAPSPQRALARIEETKAVQDLLKDPKNKLMEKEKIEGLGVWTMKYQHTYNGLEVLGSMATYHSGPAGEQVRTRLSDVKISTIPSLDTNQAEKKAKENIGNKSRAVGKAELKILPARQSQSAKLIYSIQLRDGNAIPHEVWIDAHSGALISDMARTEFANDGKAKETL